MPTRQQFGGTTLDKSDLTCMRLSIAVFHVVIPLGRLHYITYSLFSPIATIIVAWLLSNLVYMAVSCRLS